MYMFFNMNFCGCNRGVRFRIIHATPSELRFLYFIAIFISVLFLVSDLLIKYVSENVF